MNRLPAAELSPGWAVATFDRDGPVRVWTSGRADLVTNEPVAASTRFRWFSVTKLVTAACVMRAHERGEIDLDADLRDRIDWFRPRARVSVRQLLSHSAGLANPSAIRWVHPPGASLRDPATLTRATFARHRRLVSDPGAKPRYTNLGYLVLGELLEQTAGGFGGSVAGLLEHTGTQRTSFDAGDAARGHERAFSLRTAAMALLFAPRSARLVEYVREGWVGLTPFGIEGRAYGGLVGSLDDLIRLGRALLTPDVILDAASLRAMTSRVSSGPEGCFGLGFVVDGDGWVGHAGEAGGYRSQLRIHPRRGLGIAVLANCGDASSIEVLHALKREA